MAKKFLIAIDLNRNELQNPVLQNLGIAPGTPVTGQFYLDTAGAINQPTYYDGAGWKQLANRAANTYTGKQTMPAVSATVSGSISIPAGSGNTPVSGDFYNIGGALLFHNGTAAKTLAFTDSAMTSTVYIGTTAVALNRASGALALTGITSIDGNAATATLASAATATTITDDVVTAVTVYPTWVSTASGNQGQKTSSTALSFVPSTGILTATGFAGNLTGSVSGNATTATTATNLTGGNGTTLLGSMPYQSGTNVTTQLAPNTTTTKKFMRMTGTGVNGAAPAWDTLIDGDIPAALTGKTYNGNTWTAGTGTLTLAAGKTLTVSNTVTISGTDGAAVAVGAGGTVAYLATRLDQFAAPTASVSMGAQKITNLADPTLAQDATTKAYVDGAIAGLSWKEEVRAASTATVGTISGSTLTGCPTTLDGVTLVAADRVFVKDYTGGVGNGIYTVTTLGSGANGVWTRSTDADTGSDIAMMAVGISEGTTNAGRRYVLSTSGAITVGTTALTYALFASGASYTAGNGLQLAATEYSVKLPASSGLVVDGTGIYIDTAIVVRKYAASFGNAAASTFNIDHNLNTLDVTVQVYEVSTGAEVECDQVRSTVNRVILTTNSVPTSNQYRVVVHG